MLSAVNLHTVNRTAVVQDASISGQEHLLQNGGFFFGQQQPVRCQYICSCRHA